MTNDITILANKTGDLCSNRNYRLSNYLVRNSILMAIFRGKAEVQTEGQVYSIEFKPQLAHFGEDDKSGVA